MAQISSVGSLPDPISNLPAGSLKSASANPPQKAIPLPAPQSAQTDETQSSPLQDQLNRLSAALSGLQTNASVTRAQFVSAYQKVKSGVYNVSSLDISRSIVTDMLNNQ